MSDPSEHLDYYRIELVEPLDAKRLIANIDLGFGMVKMAETLRIRGVEAKGLGAKNRIGHRLRGAGIVVARIEEGDRESEADIWYVPIGGVKWAYLNDELAQGAS